MDRQGSIGETESCEWYSGSRRRARRQYSRAVDSQYPTRQAGIRVKDSHPFSVRRYRDLLAGSDVTSGRKLLWRLSAGQGGEKVSSVLRRVGRKIR
jgi:hypothetical protein